MRRRPLLLLPALLFTCGAKLDRIEKMQAAGEHQEVVEQIQAWRDKDQLGKEATELIAAQAESAFALAAATGKAEPLRTFRAAYPDAAQVPEALKKEHDLAYREAEAEGTVEAMTKYVELYPDSPKAPQARVLAEGWAYEDAVKDGTLEALDRFLATAKDSPYRETAWEAVAAKNPGIHVLDPGSRPRQLPQLAVVEGKIVDLPGDLPEATPRLVFAVNVSGAGRGDSSEWFTLRAVAEDGSLAEALPMEAYFAKKLRLKDDLPVLRALAASPGVHTARVAHAVHPLALPGACTGELRYAFVLASPGTAPLAWPFKLRCPAAAESWSDSPLALLQQALLAGDRGERTAAMSAWGKLSGMKEAQPLVEALGSLTGDARSAVLDRPGPGDFLVWRLAGGVAETAWLHPDLEGKPKVMARRPEVVVAAGEGAYALRATTEPWTVSACPTLATLPGAALVALGGSGSVPLYPDAATRLPGAGSRSISPLGSVGPYLFLVEKAQPCKPGRTYPETFAALRVDTGAAASILGDHGAALTDAAMTEAQAQLKAARDSRDLDTLMVATHHPSFPDGGDLAWRFELSRARGAPVSVPVPGLPPGVAEWADTPALVEAFWDAEPPGEVAGWSRVGSGAVPAFEAFAAGP